MTRQRWIKTVVSGLAAAALVAYLYDPPWMGELLAQRDRTHAAPTFDAAGLYLAGVDYDAAWGIPRGGRVPVQSRDADRENAT